MKQPAPARRSTADTQPTAGKPANSTTAPPSAGPTAAPSVSIAGVDDAARPEGSSLAMVPNMKV